MTKGDKAFVYDWLSEADSNGHGPSFYEWLPIETLTSKEIAAIEATDPDWARHVTVTMQINGIPVSAKKLLDRLYENYLRSIDAGIAEKAHDFGFDALEQMVERATSAVRIVLIQRLIEAGIEIDPDGDWL